MPYLLLAVGLIIGLFALYRFFLNAEIAQIKAFFLMAIVVVLCAALFTLAVSGRLPAALALLGVIAPLAVGLWKVNKDGQKEILKDDPFEDEQDSEADENTSDEDTKND